MAGIFKAYDVRGIVPQQLDALAVQDAFLTLMHGRGRDEPDEEVLEDAVAFAGVARYPARIKCALLGWMAWKDATARAQGDGTTQTEESA